MILCRAHRNTELLLRRRQRRQLEEEEEEEEEEDGLLAAASSVFYLTQEPRRSLKQQRRKHGRRSSHYRTELELELIQPHMTQKPMLRGEGGGRTCAHKQDPKKPIENKHQEGVLRKSAPDITNATRRFSAPFRDICTSSIFRSD
jgi:hypothetical protein